MRGAKGFTEPFHAPTKRMSHAAGEKTFRCSRTNSSKAFGLLPPSCSIVSVTAYGVELVRSVRQSCDKCSTAC